MSFNITRSSLRSATAANEIGSLDVKQLNSTAQISTVMDVVDLADLRRNGRGKKKRTLPQKTPSNSETTENKTLRRGLKQMAHPPPLFQRSTRSRVKIMETETKTNGPPLKSEENKDSDYSDPSILKRSSFDSDNTYDCKKSRLVTRIDFTDHTVGKEFTARSGNVATTFQVFNILPNTIKEMEFAEDPNTNTSRGFGKIERLEIFKDSHISHVLQASAIYDERICDRNIKTTRNGFMDTIIEAYMGHHNIVIRPDDVWLAIIIQFSFYVNANSEKLRKQFVNFEEKITLTVKLIGIEDINTIPYSQFLSLMTKLVDEYLVDSEVNDWILPNFSTTTADDRLTAGVALMATMKNYFKYRGYLAGCGIPEVTLEGSVEDWMDIRTRIGKLREYDLNDWVDMLEPILEQFVRAKSGDIDLEFWKNIVHHDFRKGGGLSYQPDRTFISGWVTGFCRFSKDGHNLHLGWQKRKDEPTNPDIRLPPPPPLITLPHPDISLPLQKRKNRPTYLDIPSPMQKRKDDPTYPDMNLTWPQIEMKNIAVGYVDVPVTWTVQNTDGTWDNYKTVFLGGHMAMEALPGRVTLQPRSGWVIALLKDGYGEDIIKEFSDSD